MKNSFLKYTLSVVFAVLLYACIFLPGRMILSALLLPCIYLKLGRTPALLTGAITSSAAMIFMNAQVIPDLLAMMLPAIGVSYAVSKKDYFVAAGISALSTIAGFAGYLFVSLYLNGINIIEGIYKESLSQLDLLRVQVEPMGKSALDTLDIFSGLLKDAFLSGVPSIIILYSIIIGLIALALTRAICKKQMAPVKPFATLSIPLPFTALALGISVILYIVSRSNPSFEAPFLAIQTFTMAAFTLQGLAVVSFWLQFRGMSSAGRKTSMTFLFLGVFISFVNMMLSLIGISEAVFRFRERIVRMPRPNIPPAGPAPGGPSGTAKKGEPGGYVPGGKQGEDESDDDQEPPERRS